MKRLLLAALFLFFAGGIFGSPVVALDFPARGFFNGYLGQTNILECDSSNSAAASLKLQLFNAAGNRIASQNFQLAAYGSRHIILNDLAGISNAYGTLRLTIASAHADRAAGISCRTAVYRNAATGAPKPFEFAYVLPLRPGLTGSVGGMFNSFNPSQESTPTYNWLSIINLSTGTQSFSLEVYGPNGGTPERRALRNLAPGERRDVALGHTSGQTSGVYRLIPSNNSREFEAFVIRYGTNNTNYQFAFPLRAAAGGCSLSPLQLSTMGNGLTQNWLEVANLGASSISLTIVLSDRKGREVHRRQKRIAARSQTHLLVNPFIDSAGSGNVGSARITCSSSSVPIIAQSTYYGHLFDTPSVEWAYAVQGQNSSGVDKDAQLVVPVNTYLGMANWLKIANLTPNTFPIRYTLLSQGGSAVAAASVNLAKRGTADIGLHAESGSNFIGSAVAQVNGNSRRFDGDLLRVLSRSDGQIGYIIHVPASIQAKAELPEPTPDDNTYFPDGAPWTQDISAAAKDAQSDAVISWLSSAGGWGSGMMRIDNSIEVLQADNSTTMRSFIPTEDFYSPDCDEVSMPVPVGGALEGESGYECQSDGDCHLIVVQQDSNRLYEMWRANITGGTFYGGCLAVWDLSKVYGTNGRGKDCTSADAAGFPIAPLLFTADEVAAGEIKHAIRFILPNSRIRNRSYVFPATHATGAASGGANAPPYGARFRLRANYPLESLPNNAARVVARAMQKYGMFLSDGGTIALTGQSDRTSTNKWEGLLDTRDLGALQVSDFEMIEAGERSYWTGDCVREP